MILFDVVLGYGAPSDPASELPHPRGGELWAEPRGGTSRSSARCGTAGDPQDLPARKRRCAKAGVLLAESNAQAVRLAAQIAARQTAEPGR